MKQLTFFLITCLFLGNAMAIYTGSFLSNSTGGLFSNEADASIGDATFNGLGYFTTMNSRIGIYTNFINGNGGNEQFIRNLTNNRYFLGTSGNLLKMFDGLNTGLFVELGNNTANNAINNTFNGNAQGGTGYASYSFKSYDPISGFTESWKENQTDKRVTNINSFLLNNTLKLSDQLKLGLLISYDGNHTDQTQASNADQFNQNYANMGMSGDFAIGDESFYYKYENGATSESEKGDFNTKTDNPTTNIFTGANLKAGDMGIDAFLGLSLTPQKQISTDEYTFSRNNPQSKISETEKYEYTLNRSLKTIALGGAVNQSPNDLIDLSATLQGTFGFGASERKTDNTYSRYDSTLNTGITWNQSINSPTSTKDGSISTLGAGLCGTAFLNLNEKLTLGLGLGYRYNKSNETYKLDRSRKTTTKYHDGDIEANDADDYTQIIDISYQNQKFEIENSSHTISLPAGFTWDLTESKKWQLRAGVVYTQTKQNNTNSYEEVDATSNVTITNYQSGISDTTDNTASPQTNEKYLYNGTTGADQITSNTTFSYGIRYMPFSSLTIEANGFLASPSSATANVDDLFLLDLDWYQNLTLSITFFFDALNKNSAGSTSAAY